MDICRPEIKAQVALLSLTHFLVHSAPIRLPLVIIHTIDGGIIPRCQ